MSGVPSVMYSPAAGQYIVVPVASIPFTGGLTTPLQVSVPNPASGFVTIFANNSGQLGLTDSVGNVVTLLDNPSSQDEDMNSHNIIGINSETYAGDVAINAGGSQSNVVIGNGNTSTANNDAVVIGNGSAVTGQHSVTIADTGSTNAQNFSVAIGHQVTLAAGTNGGIAIGSGAGCGNFGNAIAIGSNAVNNTTSSVLMGNNGVTNWRANSLICSLGTSAVPFLACWLRDGSPAVNSHYTMYGGVTLGNSTTETSLLTGTSDGSLVYSANQSLGSAVNIRLNITYSGLVTDTLTLRYKVNGTTVLTQVIGLAALSAVAGMSLAEFVVQASTIQCSVSTSVNGLVGEVTNASAAYNPAIANTFSLTGQWSAASASDTITVNYAMGTTVFAQ